MPVLLVNRDRLPEATAARLAEDVDVTVVGGPAAVSEDVEAEIDARAGDVARVDGATRYVTSVAAADAALTRGAAAEVVWVATGRDWPDGLVAAAAAGIAGAVLLLVDGGTTSTGVAGVRGVVARTRR